MVPESLTSREMREQIERLARKLSTPRKRFCDLYVTNGQNGTQAYLSVFYTKKPSVAATGANKLLKVPAIRAYIDLVKTFSTDEVLDHLSVTKERILKEESKLAFIDVRKMFDVDGEFLPPKFWPEEIARAIAGVDVIQKWDVGTEKWMYTYKIKFNDKGRALGRLEAVLGMNKAAGLNDEDTNLFRGFLESIDGGSRGLLPSDLNEEN